MVESATHDPEFEGSNPAAAGAETYVVSEANGEQSDEGEVGTRSYIPTFSLKGDTFLTITFNLIHLPFCRSVCL